MAQHEKHVRTVDDYVALVKLIGLIPVILVAGAWIAVREAAYAIYKWWVTDYNVDHFDEPRCVGELPFGAAIELSCGCQGIVFGWHYKPDSREWTRTKICAGYPEDFYHDHSGSPRLGGQLRVANDPLKDMLEPDFKWFQV